ncbi:MAG: cysteine--tRNA ligase [Lachnospiraceae bacterium]|nr:cysteine--tRNA ligase [Lachnospiraceae bacterium]
MKIYNTLSRKLEEFVPIEPGKITMYVCGPTVYNLIHIGNARPMIVFDTFRRYMTYRGYEVNYVSNFTDVDDKIIKAANEEGVDASEISERYIAECKKDMEGLNVMPATIHPQATKEIPGMIDMIKTLESKGYAYKTSDGTVYYRTRKFNGYGKLSGKNIDDLESGHRSEGHTLKVAGTEDREDDFDFVLWKPKKEGEPYWESPWCEGRPGWHIECSCMSKRYLGDTIDIHAGGEDLIFPHHENEIAQSEAANGVPFAHYWMHNGFLNIDNQKMSKSLGNFFTVRDIAARYDLQVLRFFMLSAQYRSPLNFSDELMESAKAGLDRIRNAVANLKDLKSSGRDGEMTEAEKEAMETALQFEKKFDEVMDNDLNTADGISVIFELVKHANTTTAEGAGGVTRAYAEALESLILKLGDVMGLILETKEEVLDTEIEALIEERQQARKNKDFARADAIRDELLSKGIQLKDTREGVKWSRI